MFLNQRPMFLYLDIRNKSNCMTIKIIENQTTFQFAVDVPDIIETVLTLTVTSQHSNDVLFTLEAEVIETNSRYTRFNCDTPSDLWDNHWEGMHLYRLHAGTNTYDTGSFKLVLNPGGKVGTEPYISNNETRQSKVIYRPNY